MSRAFGAALAVLATAASGCSLLVSVDAPVKCAPGDPDPCGPNGHCESNRCVEGLAPTDDAGADDAPDFDGNCQPEICNCADDDCDGVIDNGFDSDGDHSTTCGDCNGQFIDCNDNDVNTHPAIPVHPSEFGDAGMLPAATDRCDGRDNDCNGSTDDGSCAPGRACNGSDCVVPCEIFGCAAGMRCAADGCVAGSGCTNDGECSGATPRCDRVHGTCVAQKRLGEGCTSDAECAPGACTPLDALRLGSRGRICTLACCRDSDCPDGDQICFHAGSGARTCATTTMLGAMTTMTPGHGDAGASCGAPTDCRSLVCGGDSSCVSPCVRACPTGQICTLAADPLPAVGAARERYTMACEPNLGGGTAFARCDRVVDDPCASGLCVDGRCADACVAASDCGEHGYCDLIVESSGRDVVQGCIELSGDPSVLRARAEACDVDWQCRTNVCRGGRCTDFCCTNDGCGDLGGLCAPTPSGMIDSMRIAWAMVCAAAPASP